MTMDHKLLQIHDEITLAYDTFGETASPCLIMIMGLGAHMRVWPDELCQGLADCGFFVIRFDNRDAGASTHFDHLGRPSILRNLVFKTLTGKQHIPYTLNDMAEDVLALMNRLSITSAHIIGASMGGMIAQIVAAKTPQKVRSLTYVMSAARSPLRHIKLGIILKLWQRPQCTNSDIAIQYNVMMNQLIGSPDYPMSQTELIKLAELNYQRTYSKTGYSRQLAAVLLSDHRLELIRRIKAPTLVIHGKDDPLIPIQFGREIAEYAPNSELFEIKGMGHNLPPTLIPKLKRRINEHLQNAEKVYR